MVLPRDPIAPPFKNPGTSTVSNGASTPLLWELPPTCGHCRWRLGCSCLMVALVRPVGWLQLKGFLSHPRRGHHGEFPLLVMLELWIGGHMASSLSRAHR